MLTERSLGKNYIFEYDKDFLSSGKNPVSVTLPLQSVFGIALEEPVRHPHLHASGEAAKS